MPKDINDMTDLSDLEKVDLPFDIHQVREQCVRCVRNQLRKFKNAVDENKKPLAGRFIINCTGVPKHYLDPKFKKLFSPQEWKQALSIEDPVLWAELYLKDPQGNPWIAREYQAEILRCNSNRIALRIARRAGKCLSYRSNIFTERGYLPPKEILDSTSPIKIATYDIEKNKVYLTEDYKIWPNGKKPVYKLTTSTGRINYVTGNHPFLTLKQDGTLFWENLENLKEKDAILVPANLTNIIPSKKIGKTKSRLLGYLTGDGGTSYKVSVRFTNFNPVTVEDFNKVVNEFNCELSELEDGNYLVVSKHKDRHVKYRNMINRIVNSSGLRKLAINKSVPKEIMTAQDSDISEFLSAYWDCDGWFSVSTSSGCEIGCGTSSEKLAYDIQHLLLRLGIVSRLKKKKVKYKGKYTDSWQVTIGDLKNILAFNKKIPILAKKQQLDRVVEVSSSKKQVGNSKTDFIPEISEYINDIRKRKNVTIKELGVRCSYGSKFIGKDKLSKIAKILDDDLLNWLISENIMWDQISSIEFIGEEETYDLSVNNTNTLIADDIISHNTDLVCIDICHQIYTKDNNRIVVAGPQKVHVEEIMKRITGFIERNPVLYNDIVVNRASPIHELVLSNKSRVRGFAIGTRGKTDATSVRGQDADKIYCFPKETLVNTTEFALKPIETLTLQDTILGGNENGVKVGDIKNLGVRRGELITIPTDLNVIKCTPDHPLFNGQKDIPAEEADEVVCSLAHRELKFGKSTVFARLLGYLYGDGWISNGSVGFSGQVKDLEQIQEDLSSFGISKTTISTRITENKELGIKGITSQFASMYAYPLFKDFHPTSRKVFQPLRVPKCIIDNMDYIKASFLSGLFSAEGTGIKYQGNNRTPRSVVMCMYSTRLEWSENWMGDLSKMLSDLGIEHHVKIKEKPELERFVGWIIIHGSKTNLDNFIDKIGYCYSFDKTITANKYKLFRKYEARWKQENWKKNREIRRYDISTRKISKKLSIPLSTVKYHKNLYDELYSESLLRPEEYINKILWRENYVLLPIKKENVRRDRELVDVYNITSGADNRFFAGGFFTHNCDEMAYVDDEAITGGIFPILGTTKDTTMTGFSTPTGFKSKYYSICEEVPNYKEFHFTYRVLPNWREIEKDRAQYTDDKWVHEQEAEWGTAESGVYKPSYIDRSMRSYVYSEMRPSAGWRYIIGADWNEKHGAEITVVGENISGGYYQVIECYHVQKSEFTQLSSVQALINLYKLWNPAHVYVDGGNGCLDGESFIYTKDGIKLLKDIEIGDLLLTHNGRFKSVINTVKTGTKPTYLLKPFLCLPTKVSSTHKHVVYRTKEKFNDFESMNITKEKFLSEYELIEITTEELNKDTDFFIIPKEDISKTKSSYVVDLAEELNHVDNLEFDNEYIWTSNSYSTSIELSIANIAKKYKVSKPTVTRTKRNIKDNNPLPPLQRRLVEQLENDYGSDWHVVENKKIKRFIDLLDPDFLNLYGWYLSEGHAGVNNIEICQLPTHYKEEFDQLIKYCNKNWDINVLTRSNNGMRRLYILSSLLTEFFKKIGGTHCYDKFIDNRILENNGYQLLPSLFWGDGCIHSHKQRVELSMTSDTLVMQVRQMLINNGVLPGIHRINNRKRKDGYKDSHTQMMLYFSITQDNVHNVNKLLSSKLDFNHGIYRRYNIELSDAYLVPIRKIDFIGDNNNMYDLEIEEDSTFCVNGFATHNSTNIELLRKMSYEQRRPGGDQKLAKLLEKLKAYDSGASIITNDPVTNEKKKVPAKPYMVNASVRFFEQDKMRISSADKELEKQLRNYIVERISPNGNPVYGMQDKQVEDHKLDSLNLAMVGFFKEFGGLQQNTVITDVGSTVNPMTKRGGAPRQTNKTGTPEERRLEEHLDNGSVLNHNVGLPVRTDIHKRPIASVNDGWATDQQEEYNQRYLQRRRRNARVNRGRDTIKRSNI